MAEIDFFDDKVSETIRKAFRARRKTVDLNGRKFNIEQAPGRAGAPWILILPVDGMTPMGQISKERGYMSPKLKRELEKVKKK